MEITVQEGRVIVHKVDLVLDTEDVKIFDIDITSKYFDIDSYIFDYNGRTTLRVSLRPRSGTLYQDEKKSGSTIIELSWDSTHDRWKLDAPTASVRSFRITVVRDVKNTPNTKTLWKKD